MLWYVHLTQQQHVTITTRFHTKISSVREWLNVRCQLYNNNHHININNRNNSMTHTGPTSGGYSFYRCDSNASFEPYRSHVCTSEPLTMVHGAVHHFTSRWGTAYRKFSLRCMVRSHSHPLDPPRTKGMWSVDTRAHILQFIDAIINKIAQSTSINVWTYNSHKQENNASSCNGAKTICCNSLTVNLKEPRNNAFQPSYRKNLLW